jgi:hypothetical protein
MLNTSKVRSSSFSFVLNLSTVHARKEEANVPKGGICACDREGIHLCQNKEVEAVNCIMVDLTTTERHAQTN